MRTSFLSLSLANRLALYSAGLFGIIASFLWWFLPARLDSALRRTAEERLVSASTILASGASAGLEFDQAASVRELLNGWMSTSGAHYVLVRRADGSVLTGVNQERIPSTTPALGDQPVVSFYEDHIRVDRLIRARGNTTGSITVGLSLASINEERHAQVRMLNAVISLIALFGVLVSWLAGAVLMRPVRAMTEAALRIAQGDLSQEMMGLRRQDEIGAMAAAFDRMLLTLRAIAQAADRLGRGDLTARVDIEGTVATAVNQMVKSQRTLLSQITEAALKLAGAATQLFDLVQRQEEAVARQAAGIEEVGRTMQSLLDSASNIADSAHGVFDNAQRTRQTTEDMAGHVSALGGHTNRIAELLEVIRDIADRSDLLALNASLEATRAGEAGRAFSLVATEMRRLAERVTASVLDVKSLLVDIRSAGTSTAIATDEGRKLAESTTDSAHHITMVTQQQRTATSQVLESMREIANILQSSVASVRETRTSVAILRTTADEFRSLVGKFRLDDNGGGK